MSARKDSMRWSSGSVDLDTFVFADTPIDEGQLRELATGTFPDASSTWSF
jgi:hypothetical protein